MNIGQLKKALKSYPDSFLIYISDGTFTKSDANDTLNICKPMCIDDDECTHYKISFQEIENTTYKYVEVDGVTKKVLI